MGREFNRRVSQLKSQPLLIRLLWRALSIPDAGPEISDRIVAFDAQTFQRQPVSKEAVVNEFLLLENRTAAEIARSLPEKSEGMLDPEAMDRLLIKVHCEMQRLSEEFQHGQRVAEVLDSLLQSLRDNHVRPPLRIVDIGCGTGFVIRWLTRHKSLGEDVELLGADYHPALIEEAARLAAAENLSCRFVVGNAFRLAQPATIYISTGILHHFRGPDLIDLFSQHNRESTCAFLHFDFHSSSLSPFGSWLFHKVRMREPLAIHDGVLSAVRAHTPQKLLSAARSGAPEFVSAIYGTRLWRLPIPRAFHSLVGVRPPYRSDFLSRMGRKVNVLGVIE